MAEPAAPVRSDLATRTVSAVVMVCVAGAALWLGGSVFAGFAIAIGLGVLWEFWGLVRRFVVDTGGRLLWMVGGILYVGQAVLALIALRHSGLNAALGIIAAVIGVDIGAYFAGRTFGGPKIAPAISPSKTWSGLIGGMVGATIALLLVNGERELWQVLPTAGLGAMIAIVAQAGDFFESWMKRRAGVKDSGTVIPGHGGLFDRVDGLIAVLCLTALIYRLA